MLHALHPGILSVTCCVAAQLRHSYNRGCERNDHSLFHYGFVQDLPAPKLAALDLPQGNLYDETLHSEADYGAHPSLSGTSHAPSLPYTHSRCMGPDQPYSCQIACLALVQLLQHR
jgi:hypothetical protein